MEKINTKRKYANIMVCLMALLVMPTYFFGLRVIVLAGVALLTAVLCDIIFRKLFSFEKDFSDFSSLITALIIVMLMPATVTYSVVVLAVVIALGIAKYPFGGTKNNIFNPAAVGVAVCALSFPEQTLVFPMTSQILPLDNVIYNSTEILFQTSPASIMSVGGTPTIDFMSLAFGKFSGAIGTTCILVLGVVLLYLLLTRVISFNIIFGAFITVFSYAVLFPRVETGRIDSVIYEFCSGVFLFGLIFMASDPTTSPNTKTGRLLYGIMLALSTMIFRTVGSLDIEFVFVLLILNATYKELDRIPIIIKRYISLRKRALKSSVAKDIDVGDSKVEVVKNV